MEKSQSKTIHIGNQGKNIVASKLCRYCIVRGVGQGEDTGIDIYCEVVDDETLELSLHFFCQIKTYNKSFLSFNDNDLRYWANQPVPVFVLEVKFKDETNILDEHQVWVHDIPWILVKRHALTNTGAELLRHVADKFMLSSETNDKDRMTVYDFIYHHLPSSYGTWNIRRYGVVLPNPEIKSEEKYYTSGIARCYSGENKEICNFFCFSITERRCSDITAPITVGMLTSAFN